jgi:hypothetical protein
MAGMIFCLWVKPNGNANALRMQAFLFSSHWSKHFGLRGSAVYIGTNKLVPADAFGLWRAKRPDSIFLDGLAYQDRCVQNGESTV